MPARPILNPDVIEYCYEDQIEWLWGQAAPARNSNYVGVTVNDRMKKSSPKTETN